MSQILLELAISPLNEALSAPPLFHMLVPSHAHGRYFSFKALQFERASLNIAGKLTAFFHVFCTG